MTVTTAVAVYLTGLVPAAIAAARLMDDDDAEDAELVPFATGVCAAIWPIAVAVLAVLGVLVGLGRLGALLARIR